MSSSSASTIRQVMHDVAVCASLAFIIVLGIIHGLLHLLHTYFADGLAPIPGPVAGALLLPALRITQIVGDHAYLMLVFKLTLACTVLIFALKELVCALCSRIRWYGVDVEDSDLEEACERKLLIEKEEASPSIAEKIAPSSFQSPPQPIRTKCSVAMP